MLLATHIKSRKSAYGIRLGTRSQIRHQINGLPVAICRIVEAHKNACPCCTIMGHRSYGAIEGFLHELVDLLNLNVKLLVE